MRSDFCLKLKMIFDKKTDGENELTSAIQINSMKLFQKDDVISMPCCFLERILQ